MNQKSRWQQLLCTCEEQRARQVRQGRQVPRSCLGSLPLTGWGWFWWDIPKTFFFRTGCFFITVPQDFQYQNEIQPVWLQTAPGILLGHRFNVSLSMVQDRRLCCFRFHPSRCCPSCCYWLFLLRHWCSCRWRFLCWVFGNACAPVLGQLHIVWAHARGGRHCLADSATTIMLIIPMIPMAIPMVSPMIIMKITLELAGRDGSSVHWKADNGLGNEVGFARGRPGPPLAVGPEVVQRFKMRTTLMITVVYKNWPWTRQWWWWLRCYQVSSDGGHILATELVCFVNCPAFPLTPVPGVVFNWGQ